MDLDRWHRVERVLDRALMSDPSSWPALLDDTCRGDPGLRGEVEALLAQRTAAEEFLAAPPSAAALALVADVKERDAAKSRAPIDASKPDPAQRISASEPGPPAPDAPT